MKVALFSVAQYTLLSTLANETNSLSKTSRPLYVINNAVQDRGEAQQVLLERR